VTATGASRHAAGTKPSRSALVVTGVTTVTTWCVPPRCLDRRSSDRPAPAVACLAWLRPAASRTGVADSPAEAAAGNFNGRLRRAPSPCFTTKDQPTATSGEEVRTTRVGKIGQLLCGWPAIRTRRLPSRSGGSP